MNEKRFNIMKHSFKSKGTENLKGIEHIKLTDYDSAIKEFAKQTIHDPSFFALSPDEQRKRAKAMIQKHTKQ